MFSVVFDVVGVDENVSEVDNDRNVSEVGEDFVHETLEGGGCVTKTKGHNQEFESSVSGPKGCFPFIARSNPDIEVTNSEVDLSVDSPFTSAIKKIGDERKRITIFLGDLVKASIVNAKAEDTVFLSDEEDRGTTRRVRLADPTLSEVFVNEFP